MNASRYCIWDVFLTATSSLVLTETQGPAEHRARAQNAARLSEQRRASAPACLSALLRCAWLQAWYFSGTCCSCAQHMERYSASMPCPLIPRTARSWDSPAFAQPHAEPAQPRAALASPSAERRASHGQVRPATGYTSPMSHSTPHPPPPLVPHTVPSHPGPHRDAHTGTRTVAFLSSPP